MTGFGNPEKYWKWLLVLALVILVCLANRQSLP